jgi:tRNA (mo5U34)-methyltransferase
MERRGANVIAVDYAPAEQTGFRVAAALLGSNVEFRNANIYALSPEEYGTFDIVLFLGLLYHLPDPMQALQILRALCAGKMCVESHVIDNGVLMPDGSFQPLSSVAPALSTVPIMQFFPGAALNNDRTNYWGPNLVCLEAMLAECGFVVVSRTLLGHRGILNCTVQDDPILDYHNKIARGVL